MAGFEGVPDWDGDGLAVVEPDLDVLDVGVGVAYVDPESVDRFVPPLVARRQGEDVGTALVRDANFSERQLLGGCGAGEYQCQAGDKQADHVSSFFKDVTTAPREADA
jgi:hypothetical protein